MNECVDWVFYRHKDKSDLKSAYFNNWGGLAEELAGADIHIHTEKIPFIFNQSPEFYEQFRKYDSVFSGCEYMILNLQSSDYNYREVNSVSGILPWNSCKPDLARLAFSDYNKEHNIKNEDLDSAFNHLAATEAGNTLRIEYIKEKLFKAVLDINSDTGFYADILSQWAEKSSKVIKTHNPADSERCIEGGLYNRESFWDNVKFHNSMPLSESEVMLHINKYKNEHSDSEVMTDGIFAYIVNDSPIEYREYWGLDIKIPQLFSDGSLGFRFMRIPLFTTLRITDYSVNANALRHNITDSGNKNFGLLACPPNYPDLITPSRRGYIWTGCMFDGYGVYCSKQFFGALSTRHTPVFCHFSNEPSGNRYNRGDIDSEAGGVCCDSPGFIFGSRSTIIPNEYSKLLIDTIIQNAHDAAKYFLAEAFADLIADTNYQLTKRYLANSFKRCGPEEYQKCYKTLVKKLQIKNQCKYL